MNSLRNLLYDASVARLVQIALAEDVGTGDITSECIIPPSREVQATIVAKAAGIICGLPIAELVFRTFDPNIVSELCVPEGTHVESGIAVARIVGPARSVLAAERTALNFLQRMSGVATHTRRYVERIRGTKAQILDTRKTLPGWRILDKYACAVGGAANHRMGLYDMVLIKDNHIAVAGSIRAALQATRPLFEEGKHTIEVEVQSLEQLEGALQCGGFHRIMFDNFPLEQLRKGVERVGGHYQTEASGGITLDNVRAVAETGVDYISIGAITHSASALDISMEVEL